MELILSIASFILGVGSIIFAFITFIRTETYRRRTRIELKRVIDDAHSFRNFLLENPVNKKYEERINSFNHSLTVNLLSIDRDLAEQWIKLKPREEWDIWKVNLQINFD